MAQTGKAVELGDRIWWVGCVDWNVRDFHGYTAHRGTTYNAYLVSDEKTALIDAVKEPFGPALLEHIAARTELSNVDYVVCNHAEPDHAGAMAEVLEALPNAQLLCNAKCATALSQHFDISGWNIRHVTSGETVSLGSRTLQFIDTPLVHWPESMFTYIPEEKLLFSMDAFGQHYASSQRFDDQIELATVLHEAKAYYANIVMPYGKQASKAIQQAAALDIKVIAPSHGVIWRRYAPEIVELYTNWSAGRVRPKVLVVYDTMWGSTARMAKAIYEGALDEEVEAVFLHLRKTDLTRIATEVLDAGTIAFGSSTLNRQILPMAAAVLTYWQGLRPPGKAGFAFGSYGWGKGGVEAVNDYLESMNFEILRPPLKAQFRPTPDLLDECRAAGKMLAEKAKVMAGEST